MTVTISMPTKIEWMNNKAETGLICGSQIFAFYEIAKMPRIIFPYKVFKFLNALHQL